MPPYGLQNIGTDLQNMFTFYLLAHIFSKSLIKFASNRDPNLTVCTEQSGWGPHCLLKDTIPIFAVNTVDNKTNTVYPHLEHKSTIRLKIRNRV